MTTKTPDELRRIDLEILQYLEELAQARQLDSQDVLLRLVSVTALWVLSASQAPHAQIQADLRQVQDETFNHYARQFKSDLSIQ